jgi:hypothetical protein
MKLLVPVLVLLVACGEEPAAFQVNEDAGSSTSGPVAAKPAPVAKSFAFEEQTELYGLKYSWSAEAAAIPQLAERFTRDMKQAKTELIADTKEDRDERLRRGFEFLPYETQVSYDTAGQSDRLLSLEEAIYSFTGGAHGSSGSATVLWDRKLAREVSIGDLLLPGTSWTGAIRQPFCSLLNREREEKRGEPVKPGDLFGDCPKYEDVTVLLADEDKNGRFDHIEVIADQYVAGPYAEGPYEIGLPITAAMIERLKPDYRPSFEPKPSIK